MTRELVPWDQPGADPVADIRSYIQLRREEQAANTFPTECTCTWCRAFSIYGPEQAPEERLSPDAARWTPSLLEEEAIIARARAVGEATSSSNINSWRDRLLSIPSDPGPRWRGVNPTFVIYDEINDFAAYDNCDRDPRDTFGGETDVEASAPRDVDPPDIE